MTDFQLISQAIRNELDNGNRNFAIFPYGDIGCLAKRILEDQFGISDFILLDNEICKYNEKVMPLSALRSKQGQRAVLFTCTNMEIYEALLKELVEYQCRCVDIFRERYEKWKEEKKQNYTIGIIGYPKRFAGNIVMDRYVIINM